MSCLCFLFISLDQLSQYLPDQWSPNLQVARIMAVNERSEVSFFRSLKGGCPGNQFLLFLSASNHRIGLACHSVDSGVS